MSKDMKNLRAARASKMSLRTLVVCLAASLICSAQQSSAQLQITSPTDGTFLAPGQSLSISVISLTNTPVVNVSVFGEDPVGTTTLANSLPAQFSLAIPQDIAPRKYALTAVAGTSGGQVLYSDPVTIDVERPDMPTRLASLRQRITFTGITGPSPLRISGSFPDGAYLDVTDSSNLTFTSSNSAVATVDAHGMVNPIAQGSATITATYAQGNQSVSVSIPVTVPKPTVNPSPRSWHIGVSPPARIASNSPLGTTRLPTWPTSA